MTTTYERAGERERVAPARSRFEGCLLGGALGDALGYPIEFVTPGTVVVDRYGERAPADLRYAGGAGGVVSDDTQMTLFTAEAIVRARGAMPEAPAFLAAYQRWYATQGMRRGAPAAAPRAQGLLLADARLYARRAPGNTCLGALARSFMVGSIAGVDDPPNDSKGCGAIMRTAPIGLAARTREEAFARSRDAAALTHGHPSGYLSAAYFASLVFDVARDVPLAAALTHADALLAAERGHEETRAAVDEALRVAARGTPDVRAIEALGGGWTGEEALAIAIACAQGQSATDVPDALWRAAAHGGDSDSTGSLVGHLLGAIHGREALPARWLEALELRDLIERIAGDLWDVRAGAREPDLEAYPSDPPRIGPADGRTL